MKAFTFPEGFRFGAATAALQIEGGDRNNSWYRWAEKGHITDGASPVTACDHWNRIEEDVRLIRELGLQAYRMGIEWARIEPEEGRFDREALGRYRHELELLTEAGIAPLVTLHHFSNPLWLEDDGAWLDRRVVERFGRYVRFVVENLGDLVSEWITINEPNVYLLSGYVFGTWPPGEPDLGKFFTGARQMILAHLEAYRTIHRVRETLGYTDTRVGVAHHLRIFDPAHGTIPERLVCGLYDRLVQDIFVTAMTSGRFTAPLGAGYPAGKGRFSDFLGINYYTRDMISFSWNPGMMFGRTGVKDDAPVNDLGWEIYPEGLYRLCTRYWTRYRLPILVTENGTCDGADAFRARYIHDHLLQVRRLLDDGVKVEGYYHWTLLDNFEWLEGESARFGLYETDYATQERRLRRSGELYGKIASGRAVTRELAALYLELENGKKLH